MYVPERKKENKGDHTLKQSKYITLEKFLVFGKKSKISKHQNEMNWFLNKMGN